MHEGGSGSPPGRGRRRRRRARRVAAVGAAVLGLLAVAAFHIGPAARPGQASEQLALRAGLVPAPTTVGEGAVDPAPGQTIAGFGASGAWWPAWLASYPAAVQQRVAGLLFGPGGLALSQYRYNIGGGGAGVHVWYKAPPTFQVAPGAYDWSRDPAGLAVLRAAAQYHVPQLIGFVNSAPPAFTSNHRGCGGRLLSGEVPAYAGYLADVVRHLASVDNLRLDYVSPMNEPDTAQASCHQEGMTVAVADRAPLVRDLAAALAARGMRTRVIADESSLVSQLLAEAPQWLPSAGSAVAVVAHHTYDYPQPSALLPVAQLPVPHWATEICCFNGARFGWQYDPTMSSGLWLANTIWSDLTAAHDSAFDWWLAVSPNMGCSPGADPTCPGRIQPRGRNDGLLYIDARHAVDGDTVVYFTKRYWVMAQFSRYVRPGAVLHEVSGLPPELHAAAFHQRSGWAVVVVDNAVKGFQEASVALPPAKGRRLSALQQLLTDETHDASAVPLPEVQGDVVHAVFPAHSVTTILLGERVSAPRRG